MKKVLKVQRWVVVLEDRPASADHDFYTKAEILHDLIIDDLDGLTIKSIKKETK